MGNIAVICRSKSGYTHKYAQWIAEAAGADLLTGRVAAKTLLTYDTILYGGGLYAGKMNGISLISDYAEQLKGKKTAVFCVCLTPYNPKVHASLKQANVPESLSAAFFMLRGGFDISKCRRGDRLLMRILRFMLKRKKNPDGETLALLDAFDHPVDFTSRENIDPILAYIDEK